MLHVEIQPFTLPYPEDCLYYCGCRQLDFYLCGWILLKWLQNNCLKNIRDGKGQEQYNFTHMRDIKQKVTKQPTNRHRQQYGNYQNRREGGRGRI